MEIQVLDDSAPRYAKLNPTQYHGSIYKRAAAKRGHLKPGRMESAGDSSQIHHSHFK